MLKYISAWEKCFSTLQISHWRRCLVCRISSLEARNARNKANKSALKTAMKKFEAAAAEGNRTEAEGAYKVAVKMVDQSVRKGILHKNNAAHKKSAMTLKLNRIG